ILAAIWLASLLVNEVPAEPRQASVNHIALFWRELNQPAILAFFFACFLLQLSHGPYYTFYTIYLDSLDYPRLLTGLLWSLGVVAEIILFWVMHRLLSAYSLRFLLLVTLVLTSVRWLMIALFAELWPVLVAAQLLHAASFGSFHAVAIEMVRRHFSEGSSGQAQAFYSAVSFGAGGAVGALLSGWLWVYGPGWLFLLAALSVLPGIAAVYWLVRE
ncbi:MAG TPA: MFS transporter, partial [Pseudomonadales bacterium]